MSFGGGGGGGSLIAHTHNSSIVNDGGDLSTAIPTQINGMPIQVFTMVYG